MLEAMTVCCSQSGVFIVDSTSSIASAEHLHWQLCAKIRVI